MQFMEQIDYIICGDYVLTMNGHLEVIHKGAVAIKGSEIIAVGGADSILSKYSYSKMIGGKDRVVMPGLINSHCHAPMVYFRGLADDLPLKTWLENHIWPAENRWLSPEFVRDATELACLEMLRAGVTIYNDMYFFADSAAEASKSLGIRGILGSGIIDFPTISGKSPDDYLGKAENFISKWKGDDLIIPSIAPHAAHTCCPDTLLKSKALAARLDVPIHMHLSETEWEVEEIVSQYGKRPVEHLENIGFLDDRLIAAHCVHVNEMEIGILRKRNVAVAHCVESNLKLASGVAPIPAMLKAGVKVSFGTDGAASNNDLSVLSEMSTAAKLHKAIAKDPTVLDSKTAVLMATKLGAEALGLGHKIGSIEKGKAADVISIDLRKPHLMPLYDIYSHIVYSAMASDIKTVLVNGKLLIDDGEHTSGRDEEILRKAAQWQTKIAAYNNLN